MAIMIAGLGELSNEQWDELSPKNDYDLMLERRNGGQLFMGGTPDNEDTLLSRALKDNRSALVVKDRFDVRVDLYGYNLRAAENVIEHVIQLGDSDIDRWSPEQMLDLGDAVFLTIEALNLGERVLVNCQAGLNRSGLVTALALVAHGYEPETALHTIREGRSSLCLVNESFVEFLMERGKSFVATL